MTKEDGMIILFIFALLILIAWIILELKGSKSILRLSGGIVSMIAVAWIAYFAGSIQGSYESYIHKADIKALGEILEAEDIAKAQKAISTYNKTVKEGGSTYQASIAMWHILSEQTEWLPFQR